jgi:hypothetical protein
MSIEILETDKPSGIYFGFCHSCDDIREEDGDPMEGPLQLSGDGVRSLEEAVAQTERHQRNYQAHHKTIVEGV